MATNQAVRPTTHYTPPRAMRKFMAQSSITFFGLLVLMLFLLPLGYMATTAFKNPQQIIDVQSGLLPNSPATFNYEGKDYPVYKVPTETGTHEWALVRPRREDSDFVDPANPAGGLIHWVGRWRTLELAYFLDPAFGNFAEASDTVKFPILFRNTFIIAIAGTIGTLISSICVAYGFSRFRVPGINIIFIVLISTIILPGQVTLIPKYIFFRTVGWVDSFPWGPLIVPHFFANAYNVFLLRQYFRSIPKDMDEAAMIDGASPLQTLLYVIVPQSLPALTAVGLFHFFFAWNDFFEPLVYLQGKEDLYPISVGLQQFANSFGSRPDLLMAAAIMAIALPIIIFFLAQRVFLQGIVITGVEK